MSCTDEERKAAIRDAQGQVEYMEHYVTHESDRTGRGIHRDIHLIHDGRNTGSASMRGGIPVRTKKMQPGITSGVRMGC